MAQSLSPVCTDTFKFQNPVNSFCSRNRYSRVAKNSVNWSSYGGKRKIYGRTRVASQDSLSNRDIADDYYAVLGLVDRFLGLGCLPSISTKHLMTNFGINKTQWRLLGKNDHLISMLPDATPGQIKKAYYNCMKACHPDLSGNDPETTNFCMFINEVYEVLSDPVQRMVYDEIHGYALTAINPFLDDSSPKDHVFVDEFSCIGCKNCANVCPDVFGIEEDFGRARVYSQSGNSESVQQAVESCPVDCIHWTSAAQLSLLEDEMRRVERVNVALMLSGMGSSGVDVFRMASSRWEKRQLKVSEQAKTRMTKQKDSDITQSYWNNIWGKPKDRENSEKEVKERARRAAAAARRWREYSRRGADKPPTFKLPEAVSNKEQ